MRTLIKCSHRRGCKHLWAAMLLLIMCLAAGNALAQTTIKPTGETTQLNGKKYYFHIVEQGQSVFAIARAYGLHYSAAILRTDLQHVNAYDTVWLPINDQSRAAVQRAIGAMEAAEAAATTMTIKVEKGMTLYRITKNYNVTEEELYKLNPGLKESGLKAGQDLVVPNPKAKETGKAEAKPTSSQRAAGNAVSHEGQYRYKDTQESAPAGKGDAQRVKQQPATIEAPAIRERVSSEVVTISLMMPLHLNKLNEISTTKFDVDQRGKKDYKSFEFIQFYEGIQMALAELENRGVSVRLNVVDVVDENEATIRQAYTGHNVAQSDLLIALLQRRGFETVATMARADRLFTVNPLSTREQIIEGNPYVVKYMPSTNGKAKALISAIRSQYSGAPLFLLTSGAKEEEPAKVAWETLLASVNQPYTLLDWTRQQSKLSTVLKGDRPAVVVSLYERGKEKNRIQTNLMLNRLNALKSNTPVLVTMNNLVRDMADVDFTQLQNCSYHFVYPVYLDYNNAAHKNFIDKFKEQYKTEPQGEFAGAGYDVMLYFATALHQTGTEFWSTLHVNRPAGMLFPLRLQQMGDGNGYENQAGQVYKLVDYQLRPVAAH